MMDGEIEVDQPEPFRKGDLALEKVLVNEKGVFRRHFGPEMLVQPTDLAHRISAPWRIDRLRGRFSPMAEQGLYCGLKIDPL